MTDTSRSEEYLKELTELTENPIHKQLISAYTGDNPKKSIELELGQILLDMLEHED